MPKKAIQMSCRVNPDVKEDVEHILEDLGLTLSDAIRIFMKRVQMVKGIPFELRLPNAELEQSFKDGENGNVKRAKSVDDFMSKMADL